MAIIMGRGCIEAIIIWPYGVEGVNDLLFLGYLEIARLSLIDQPLWFWSYLYFAEGPANRYTLSLKACEKHTGTLKFKNNI